MTTDSNTDEKDKSTNADEKETKENEGLEDKKEENPRDEKKEGKGKEGDLPTGDPGRRRLVRRKRKATEAPAVEKKRGGDKTADDDKSNSESEQKSREDNDKSEAKRKPKPKQEKEPGSVELSFTNLSYNILFIVYRN